MNLLLNFSFQCSSKSPYFHNNNLLGKSEFSMVGKKAIKSSPQVSQKRLSNLEKHVKLVTQEEDSSKVLCISVRNNKLAVSGEQGIVAIFKNEVELANISLRELLEKCQKSGKDNQYEMYRPLILPPLTHKFESAAWNWKAARDNLTVYFQVMGFGRGSSKSYGGADCKPEWWPNNTDAKLLWNNFKHPSDTCFENCNFLLSCIFDHYNINPETFFVDSGSTNVKKNLSDHEDKGDIIVGNNLYEQMPNEDLVAKIEADEQMFDDEIPINTSDTLQQIVDDEDYKVYGQDAGHVEQAKGDLGGLSGHEDIEDIDAEHFNKRAVEFHSLQRNSVIVNSKMYEQMLNDDFGGKIEADEQIFNDDRLPQTPEIPTNISDATASFERSAERKRKLRILNQSSGLDSDTAEECSYIIKHGFQTKKKRDNDDVTPFMQLRMNNIAEREAAIKAAEERLLHQYTQLYPNVGFDSRPGHRLFA